MVMMDARQCTSTPATVNNVLLRCFQNSVISINNGGEWPPGSPDSTPCDFSLCGYSKNKTFTSPPGSFEDSKIK